MFGVAATVVLLAGASARAAPPAEIGKVKTAAGDASLVRAGAKVAVKVGDPVFEHDIIETGEGGSLGVTFKDNTSFSCGPKSHVAIDTYFFDPGNLKGKLFASVGRGTLMVRSGELTKQQPGAIQVKTPRTVLGVRGTTFLVSIEEQ